MFLLVTFMLMGCVYFQSDERLITLNKDNENVVIPRNCFFLDNFFQYDKDNNIQYAYSISKFSSQDFNYKTLTSYTDDDIFDVLLQTCEICQEEYPEKANKYKEGILRVYNEKKERIRGIEQSRELEIKRKSDIAKKYGAEWCDGGIMSKKNTCLLEGEFQIFEQQEEGTFVKPRIHINREEIQMLAAFSQLSTLVSMTTSEPDEFNRTLNDIADEMQQLVFIESNPKDSNQIDGAIVKGLFLRDGVYKYISLGGTRTVKKIKRLQ